MPALAARASMSAASMRSMARVVPEAWDEVPEAWDTQFLHQRPFLRRASSFLNSGFADDSTRVGRIPGNPAYA